MLKRKPLSPLQSGSKTSVSPALRSTEPPTMTSPLIGFYEGHGYDHRGRYLVDILKWGSAKLESSHDYIQTLFPLPEESGVAWNAPIINKQVFEAFRSRSELRCKLRDSLKRMLWFYGFEFTQEDSEPKVQKGENYQSHSRNWDVKFDHNHLRITRIIRSLRVLGLEDEAQAFYSALEEASTRASSRSREFWRRAAERPLNIRPDLESEFDGGCGPKFLRDFEKAKAKRKHDENQELGKESKAADAGTHEDSKNSTILAENPAEA